jgi:hypothetical protein
MKKRKSWAEKLHQPKPDEVVTIDKPMLGLPAGTKLLIPSPLLVDKFVRQVPPGHFMTPVNLRLAMASEFEADNACPLVTGIHLRIVAEAAWEELQAGAEVSTVAPFWRVIHPKSPLAKKIAAGIETIVSIQEKEGVIPQK